MSREVEFIGKLAHTRYGGSFCWVVDSATYERIVGGPPDFFNYVDHETLEPIEIPNYFDEEGNLTIEGYKLLKERFRDQVYLFPEDIFGWECKVTQGRFKIIFEEIGNEVPKVVLET